jgi:maltose alpha-D-glucosyltransferase/alpha-amylase
MRINLGIRRRLAPLLGNDRRKIELLNALLFSLPGTPVLYYGDEIGMGDNVYLGDRDGVRTPMQWSADRNAGFSESNPHRLYLPLITEQGYHYESLNVASQVDDPTSLLSWMRQLIALRKRRPVLGRGAISFLEPENVHVLAFVRSMEGEPPFLCVANLSRLAQHVELDLRQFHGHVPVEAFGQTRFAPISESSYHVTLAPYGFFWFTLEAPDRVAAAERVTPTLSGTWDEVLRRRAPLARAIGQWLPTRRWYAGKELHVRTTTVEDVIALPGGEVDCALLVVRVEFTEGDDHRYAVPVARADSVLAARTRSEHPGAVVAQLAEGQLLIDAMSVPEGAAAIVGATLRRRAVKGRVGGVRGVPRRTGLARIVESARDVQPMGVEQSNSSVLVAHRLIAKLVRRLEPGPNPDVELPLHLRARRFANVPGVAATLELALAGEQQPADAVIVHDALANEGDLWTSVLDELSVTIEQRGDFGTLADDDELLRLARLLGTRTAELHTALATSDGHDDMAPQSFTLLWQRSLLQTLRNGLRTTQRAVRRAKLDDPRAEQLLAPADDVLARFESLRTVKLDARRIRVHGDLHLGQILRTGTDIAFIDFEGEPGRPMGERRIMRSPLTDVAGLLRSVDYAGRSAVDTAVARGVVTTEHVPELDTARDRWTDRVCNTINESYLHAIGPAGIVPSARADADLLLDVYLLQKGLYEVRYELANRPDWVHWPLSAVVEMLAR